MVLLSNLYFDLIFFVILQILCLQNIQESLEILTILL